VKTPTTIGLIQRRLTIAIGIRKPSIAGTATIGMRATTGLLPKRMDRIEGT
jgi:hypothetical protein